MSSYENILSLVDYKPLDTNCPLYAKCLAEVKPINTDPDACDIDEFIPRLLNNSLFDKIGTYQASVKINDIPVGHVLDFGPSGELLYTDTGCGYLECLSIYSYDLFVTGRTGARIDIPCTNQNTPGNPRVFNAIAYLIGIEKMKLLIRYISHSSKIYYATSPHSFQRHTDIITVDPRMSADEKMRIEGNSPFGSWLDANEPHALAQAVGVTQLNEEYIGSTISFKSKYLLTQELLCKLREIDRYLANTTIAYEQMYGVIAKNDKLRAHDPYGGYHLGKCLLASYSPSAAAEYCHSFDGKQFEIGQEDIPFKRV